MLRLASVALALLLATPASAQEASPPRVEVAFVLDTTGSMSGLIEGAKQKIWQMAGDIAAAKPTPEVKFALIGYRDRGDEYITQVHRLTDDLDAIYGHLQALSANGGGDGPESVNQALHEAVHDLGWSDSRDVLKIIFLVGDAPPHMDYEQDVPYTQTCSEAVQRDLIINTIQCGSMGGTREVWQEIARLAEGSYAAIDQGGGVQHVSTPVDDRLAELNRQLSATVVPYGTRLEQAKVEGKVMAAARAPAAAQADRLRYMSASEPGSQAITGGNDLVAAVGSIMSLEQAAHLPTDELPEALREMAPEQREKHLAELQARRSDLQMQIQALVQERAEYVAKQRADLPRDGFDEQVGQMIRDQARRKGIAYEQAQPEE